MECTNRLENNPFNNLVKAALAYQLKIEMEHIFLLKEDPEHLLNERVCAGIEVLKKAGEVNVSSQAHTIQQPITSTHAEIEKRTHTLYGDLWVDFDSTIFFDEAYKLLLTRLERNNVDLAWFKDKACLDAGCGGGRYTVALSRLGFKKVVGIDIGSKGLADAGRRVKECDIKNVDFVEGSVLDLPFENSTFDFVFSNGVLHHTTDTMKGLEEIYRVLKPGGKVWLYLYGTGGFENLMFACIREMLRDVPREFTQSVMVLLGVPPNRRFYLLDHYYVPIRNLYTEEQVVAMLRKAGFLAIHRLLRGVDFDTVEKVSTNQPYAQLKYGVGDLRFMVEKPRA